MPASALLRAEEARRDDPGGVDDERVPRFQVVGQVVEMPVFELPRLAEEMKHARVVARLDGGLRDLLLRQVEVKIGCLEHGADPS